MKPLRLKHAYSNSVTAVLIIFLTAIVANGCIPVLIPTPSYGVRVITEETVESLRPGQSTRADVLHLLGDPVERIEEDQFFVYGGALPGPIGLGFLLYGGIRGWSDLSQLVSRVA